jgi:hypothetical protein
VDIIKGVDTLDRGMVHFTNGKEHEGMKFHYVTQNDVQLKTYEWLISVIFLLIFSDHG